MLAKKLPLVLSVGLFNDKQ